MAGISVLDLVKLTTTTTGTGTLTVSVASGYQTPADGVTYAYRIRDGSAWEIGVGVYTSSGTALTRATVLKSSNSNALVSLAAGTKEVVLGVPSAWYGAPLTTGSVLFADANGFLAQDNANLFWDDANNRLRIGTNALAAGDWYDGKLYVAISGAASPTEQAAHFRHDYSGTHLAAYAPVELACVYTSTSAVDAFTQTYSGLQSTLYYGTAAAAARGTCCSMVSQIVSVNSGDNEDELAPWEGVVRFDNTNNGAVNTTPGRAWMTDWAVHGSIGQQQGALGGVHSFMDNYYAGPPRDGLAGAYWAITGQGYGTALDFYHANAPTYQLGVGYGVVGYSTGAFTRGWEIGVQVGGSGSNWNTPASHLGTGVEVGDYDNVGIHLSGLFTGVCCVYVTNGGSGYTSVPIVGFSAPPGTGVITPLGIVRLTATSVATGAGAITVTTAGSGYTASQELYCTFSAPFPSGCPAAAKVTADGSGNIGATTALVFGGSGTATATLGVATVAVAAGGTGYVVGDTLTVSGGTSTTTAQLRVNAVTAGVITAVSVSRVGVYSVIPSSPASVTGGTGASATFTLTWKVATVTFLAGGSAYPKSRAGDLPVSFVISGNRTAYGFATTDASGVITAVTLSNAGSGYTAAGTATVDTYGSGYTALPAISIPAPVSGTTAIASPLLAATSVAAVYVTLPGKGYLASPPVVLITGGGGSGATAVATVTGCGLLKDATITGGGTGYSPIDPPVVSFSGGQGASGTVTTTVSGGVLITAVPAAAGSAYPANSIVYLTVAGGTGGIIAANTNAAGGLNIAGSGCTMTITVSGGAIVTATTSAGGTLYPPNSLVFLAVSSGTNGLVAVATNASGVCAGTAVVLRGGSGYSAGTNATTLACYIVNGGTGYSATTAATANYLAATGKAVISIYGNVTATFITDPGGGYSSVPTVTIAAPVVTTAQGYATVAGNAVTGVVVTLGGVGYIGTIPTISFSGGGGSNATAAATVYFGTVKYATVTAGGSGYSSAPAVTFTAPAAGTQATATGRLGGYAIQVEAGAGSVLVGASSSVYPTAMLEVIGPSSVNNPVAAFGSLGSTDANALVLRNGGNLVTWWHTGFAGGFYAGTAAQDTGFTVPATCSFWVLDSAGSPVLQASLAAGLKVGPGIATAEQFVCATADFTLSAASGAQNLFAAANDVLTVAAATTYFFEAELYLTTGATTHTTAFLLGGTATYTSVKYLAQLWSGTAGTISTTAPSMLEVSVATSTVLNATSTATSTVIYLKGTIRVNAAGTLIPQINFSANPTSTNLTKTNSKFRLWPVGSNVVAAVGNWA